MRTLFHPKREDISLPAVLYALSDPLRLKIVTELAGLDEAISCSDCSASQGIAKSTQSHHFKVLREAGVTNTTPQGTRLFITLRREDLQARFPGLLDAVLRAYHATMAIEE
ncbi:helix-turn-helix transcriptional regulator [Ktedonobacter sp. SOSP1-52]|uniref:ArsR/SmtB family transcription factor n=1 Tax=Ktedonobacter sp. SOSP1-52 TaxID=2778366 RepID=UPI001916388D|nr:winged helix-turn-helix domain-containing protein [Ktedonobacter sp. SOSP1-52]